jgi:hypothetical protein
MRFLDNLQQLLTFKRRTVLLTFIATLVALLGLSISLIYTWNKDFSYQPGTEEYALQEVPDSGISSFEAASMGQFRLQTSGLRKALKGQSTLQIDALRTLMEELPQQKGKRFQSRSAIFTPQHGILAIQGTSRDSLYSGQIKSHITSQARFRDLEKVAAGIRSKWSENRSSIKSGLVVQQGRTITLFKFIPLVKGAWKKFDPNSSSAKPDKKSKKAKQSSGLLLKAGHKKLSVSGLILANTYDFDLYRGRFSRARLISLVLSILFTILITYMTWTILGDSLRPLRFIKPVLQELSRGNFRYYLASRESGEIQDFVTNVNDSIRKIERFVESELDEARSQARRATVERMHGLFQGEILGSSRLSDISIYPKEISQTGDDDALVVHTARGLIGAVFTTREQEVEDLLARHRMRTLLEACRDSQEELPKLIQQLCGTIANQTGVELLTGIFGVDWSQEKIYTMTWQELGQFVLMSDGTLVGLPSNGLVFDGSPGEIITESFAPGSCLVSVSNHALANIPGHAQENIREMVVQKALDELHKSGQPVNSRNVMIYLLRSYRDAFKSNLVADHNFSAVVIRRVQG